MTNDQNETPYRPVTISLAGSICFHDPLTPAAMVDFGIDTPDHFKALSDALRSDAITVRQLDDALGNGPMLTALVNDAGCNPQGVVFQTSWDVVLYGRMEELPEKEPSQPRRRQPNRQRDNERER